LQSKSFNLTSGWHRLYLDFQVPEELDLELALNSGSAPLYRNSSGAVYPYKIGGVLEMFEGWPTASRYYFFYDWNVFIPDQQCSSGRIPVHAIIGSDPTNVFDRAVCDSGSVMLEVQSPETVNWYDSTGIFLATGNRFTTPLLNGTTTYSLEVGSCARIPVLAEVIQKSTDPVVPPVNNCGPGQVLLEAISNDPVNWYDAPVNGNLYGSGYQFLSPYVDSANTFYAIAGSVCPANPIPAYITITSASSPTVQSASACAPASVMLSAQSPDPVFWYNTATGGTAFNTGNTFITPLLNSNTTYYVEANNGCASARVPVTANLTEIPVPLVSGSTRCGAGSVVLSANSLYNLSWWTDSLSGIQVGSGISYTTDSLTGTTGFFVQASDGVCTSTRVFVIAEVNITSPPVATGDSRCGFGIVNLTANATAPLSWFSSPAGGNAIFLGNNFTPLISSDTSFWVAAGASCSSIRVRVDAQLNDPSADPYTIAADICAPDNAMLIATPSSATDPIQWFNAPNGTVIGTNDSLVVTIPDYGSSYDTLFYVTAGAPGCESNPVPLNVHVDSRPIPPFVTGGSNCGPGNITLTASSFFPVRWSDGNGNIIANGPSFVTNVATTTSYQVSVFDGNCQSNEAQVTATVLELPSPSISGPDTIVIIAGQISVLSVISTGGDPPYTYLWSPAGQTTSSVNAILPGNYS
ncbi:MAG: hypothetical protein ACKOA1_12245, partial [Bacteroidota bacterium]